MNLSEQFNNFIWSNHLLSGQQPVLLAVSGGVDSVVMAHLFRGMSQPFSVAHCNFQLRGEESDEDEHFVRQLAANWKMPFWTKRFETRSYAEKNGVSIQMAARELRYAWFRELAIENGFTRVAVAHNLDDSVESALLNFVRGTGLSGLMGMAMASFINPTPDPSPEGRGDVELTNSAGFSVLSNARGEASPFPSGEGSGVGLIRPLLFAPRSDIESYARARNIAWREDSSNLSDDYARNFLRHRIVPLLQELNPNFLHTAAHNLARLRETGDNLHFLMQHFPGEKKISENEFSIDKTKLLQLPAPHRALRELLRKYGFTEEQARQVANNPDHVGLELYSLSGWRLLNDRDNILLVSPQSRVPNPQSLTVAIQPDDMMVTLPGGGRLVLMYTDVSPAFPDGRSAVLTDAEKLCFPLTLRPWQPGDAFQPFGMGGHSQKLQDFFTNLKMSRLEKDKILILVNGDGAIVWIVGHRPDERFKVTPGTKKFLKITYL